MVSKRQRLGRTIAAVLAAVSVAARIGTAGEFEAPGRLYGNMPFSLDPTALPPQFHFTAQHIGEDSSLLALHMEWFGVPWEALASGGPLPHAWLAELDRADALRKSLGLPVYLAVSPISGTRDRLAARAYGDGDALLNDNDFGVPCEDVAARGDAAAIRRAFHALVDLYVARFEPRYLALSIEVNIYTQACPRAWASMRDLLNAEYETQKAAHPDLPIFHTFQAEFLWQADRGEPCFGFQRDCLVRNIASFSDLRGDLWGLSSYPVPIFLNNGRMLPEDYFDAVAKLSGRPVAVSETGYLSRTYSAMVSNTCIPGLPSSVEDQSWWMGRLLSDAERLRMPFVVWWVDHAPMPFDDLAPCICSDGSPFCRLLTAMGDGAWGIRYFGLMALRDYDGTPTPALALWKAAVAANPGRHVHPPSRARRPPALGR
jgi:hypothetical protein